MMNSEDVKLWASRKQGVKPGTPGHQQFCLQAAKLLSTLPYNILFSSSRVSDDGKEIKNSAPELKNEEAFLRGDVQGRQVVVHVEHNKIANIYNTDGSVNEDVLSVCLEGLERIAVVTHGDTSSPFLDRRFVASTGRDRFLDFMGKKCREAQDILAEAQREQRKAHAPEMG